ncbi:hypothetical protein DEO23_10540 [Brachybacterium endophyticum]|uniref:Oxygen sensor histidine kinase NreB n=1 Tax=Brachybacterium endophyticum TaxID=2182385 RepID=A0A2U2RIG2_9MICO|nr:ATP-binding protein [Brachybacterium endophyticum]PWH05646.1 hypothetical protein DEO23_10540 [Brachybacterium endophyticum]
MTSPAGPQRAPYAQALRWLVHALVYLLVAIAALRTLPQLPETAASLRLVLLVALVSVYSIGARMASARGIGHRGSWWALRYLVPVLLLWACCFTLSGDAVWIAFGLDFAVLYALPLVGGVSALVVVTAVAAGGFALWEGPAGAAGILGPVLGALVALAVVLVVRTLQDVIDERTQLAQDLLDAQDQIARTQRETARAEERERIARDLHDTVAQSALSIQMLLDAARTALEASDLETASGHLAQARGAAALTSRQTRAFVDADGASASGTPLHERLQEVLTEMAPSSADSPRVQLRWELAEGEDGQVPERAASALERITRSLVGNVLQHADASRAVLTVGAQDGDLVLDVVDDGLGFDPSTAEGFGLRTVRARARAAGGDVTVESAPGEGTAVQVRLPVGAAPGRGTAATHVVQEAPAADIREEQG